LAGGQKGYVAFEKLPGDLSEGVYGESFRFLNSDTNKPQNAIRYFIELDDGTFVHGKTDENGFTEKISSDKKNTARVAWGIEALKRISKISGE
jgi:uncharacterized protein (DUF2345 family)